MARDSQTYQRQRNTGKNQDASLQTCNQEQDNSKDAASSKQHVPHQLPPHDVVRDPAWVGGSKRERIREHLVSICAIHG